MKTRFLLAWICLVPAFAQAAAYETYIDRRNASNSQTIPLTVPVPIADAIYYYDKSTFWPRLALIGSGLQVSGGYINAITVYHNHDAADITTGVFDSFRIPLLAINKIDGLQSALDSKAAAGGSVAWSAITGFTGVTSVNAYTGAVTLTYGDVGAEASGASAAAQAYSVQRSNHTGTQPLTTISDAGTSAALDVATSGDASSSQVVKGNDSRLSDSRTPTAHSHVAGQITDFNAAADDRITAKFSGNSSQVVLANGSFAALPVPQVIQRTRAQTDASGNYTWTYPVAYGAGVVPIISAISESASSTVPQGVQIVGVPTNTSATFKVINLPSTSVVGIVVLGAPTGAQAYIHLTAIAP